MLSTLTKPSLSAIRVRFIQEKLKKLPVKDSFHIRVVATGRTGSGKSTLGNRLIGIEYFLKSDGYMNCTDKINIIQFPAGLEYADLPGVSSDEQFENYNRAALGMQQVSSWPFAETLTIKTYYVLQQPKELQLPIKQVSREQLLPDLIYYLVAPHQQLLPSDISYITDLLKLYGSERIIFVFNLFTDKENINVEVTTPQNIIDARNKIAQAYTKIEMNPMTSKIAEVNCWTGQGIADLIELSRITLNSPQGKLFAEVIRYQQKRAPSIYLADIKKELVRFFARVAFEKPNSSTQGQDILFDCLERLMTFLSDALEQKLVLSKAHRRSFKKLAKQLSEQLRQENTEPIIESRSKAVYTSVPVFKTVEETDYSNPLFREEPEYKSEPYWDTPDNIAELLEATGNMLDGDGFRVKRWRTTVTYRKVLVGYGTRKRSVIDYYAQEYSHTEHWNEQVGNRIVDVVYEPLGIMGIALLSAASHALLAKLNSSSKRASIETIYQNRLENLRVPLHSWHEFSEDALRKVLEKNFKILFDASFDECFKKCIGVKE